MLRGLIKTATLTCVHGTKEECAAAWDHVEEVSKSIHRRNSPKPKPRSTVHLSKVTDIGTNIQKQRQKLKEQQEDLFFLWKYYNYGND